VVCRSSRVSQRIACPRDEPHISGDGGNERHTSGRSGRPKSRQRSAASSWVQGTPAGLGTAAAPSRPGTRLEIEGAMQQAAQPGRQDGGFDEDMGGLSRHAAIGPGAPPPWRRREEVPATA